MKSLITYTMKYRSLIYLIASALFYFIFCWSIDSWEDGKGLFVFLMFFLPGVTFPLTTINYRNLNARKYSWAIALVYIALSVGIYYGCVWLFSAEMNIKYSHALAGSCGSLAFLLLTKFLLRVKLPLLHILCAAILSGLAFIPCSVFRWTGLLLGTGIMLWTLVNGVLLYYYQRRSVDNGQA